MLAKALEHSAKWNERGADVASPSTFRSATLADATSPTSSRACSRALVPAGASRPRGHREPRHGALDEYVRTAHDTSPPRRSRRARRLRVGLLVLTQLHRLTGDAGDEIDRGFNRAARLARRRQRGPRRPSTSRRAALETVAEGVASMEVLERLGTSAATSRRGFAIGMPMHASEVLPWIRGRQRGPLRLSRAARTRRRRAHFAVDQLVDALDQLIDIEGFAITACLPPRRTRASALSGVGEESTGDPS